jgi:hypothetical protein
VATETVSGGGQKHKRKHAMGVVEIKLGGESDRV